MDVHELKWQRALRRAVSLSKDRANYDKRTCAMSEKKSRASSQRPHGWKTSVAQKDSNIATPHRMARAATRTCLAKGMLEGGSDMPQISLGHSVWKPSVSAMLNYPGAQQEHSAEMTSEQVQQVLEKADETGREILAAQVALHSGKNCLSEAEAYKACGCSTDVPRGASQEQVGADKTFVSGNELVNVLGHELWEEDPLPFENITSPDFHVSLGDDTAFPALAVTPRSLMPHESSSKSAVEPAETQVGKVWTPEKSYQPCPSTRNTSPKKSQDEEIKDWVVLSSDDVLPAADTLCKTKMESFDGQHPRNIFANFARKNAAKSNQSQADGKDAGIDIDWSQTGIPTEVRWHIVHASMNAAHRSLYAKREQTYVPLGFLNAQNRDSSRRQRSVTKMPRSQSKPRIMQQMRGKH